MKTQSSSKKSIISIAVVIIVLLIGYFYFSGGSPKTNSSLVQSQPSPEAALVGNRILNLLNQIRSLKIDSSFFKGAAYQSLIDYSVAIPQVDVGRPNPFAPLPGMPASTGNGSQQ